MRLLSRMRSLLADLLRKEKIERQLDNELGAYVVDFPGAGLASSKLRR